MNTLQFRRNLMLVIGLYIVSLLAGLVLGGLYADGQGDRLTPYERWADLQPLVVAVPAAWLGYCFQRRQAYIKDVRDLWGKTVPAVQSAIQYTHGPTFSQEKFGEVLCALSTVIDEIRGVFRNIEESSGRRGLYPVEALKGIYEAVSALGFGSVQTADGSIARKKILTCWNAAKLTFLVELPRGVPEKASTLRFERVLTEHHRDAHGGQEEVPA